MNNPPRSLNQPVLSGIFLLLVVLGALLTQCGKHPRLLKVETLEVSDVSYNSARASGMLVDVGESGVDNYGLCWAITHGPEEGSGFLTRLGFCDTIGPFSCLISGLSPDTKYFVRSYAKEDSHVVYGEELSFTTGSAIYVPVVTTTDVSSVEYTSAWGGGEITDDGGSPVSDRGVCWGVSSLPDIYGPRCSNGEGSGSYFCNLSPLTEGEGYYYRAYATNATGTGYGEEKYFDTRVHAPTIVSTAAPVVQSHAISMALEVSGLRITRKGVCYSKNPAPSLEQGTIVDQNGTSSSFTAQIQGLEPMTTYYLRPFVINSEGTVYGIQSVIETSPMIFDLEVSAFEMYDGCGEDGLTQGPGDHEICGYVAIRMGGQADTLQLGKWYNSFSILLNQWKSLLPYSTSRTLSGIDQTQSVVISFDIDDYDSGDPNDWLDTAEGTVTMHTILDLDHRSPTTPYSGTYLMPRDSSINGRCLKLVCKFEFSEK